ncbi:MAG: two-component sensor histidine kinase [Gammaproteobacteria bacterium]|nr:two-component sensor histidine kinase [Gammaproteobacteria bacterium]
MLAMVLVAGGVGLDAAFYPEHSQDFGLARLVVVALIGAALWSYSSSWGLRHVRGLTYFWIALPQLMIAWMIFSTDGEASIYFVGLTLAVSGISIFLPLTLLEALVFSVFTMLAYTLACVLRVDGVQHWPVLAGQLMFVLFFSLIAITVSVYGDRQRRQTYALQTEVQRQKDELLAQNKALVEIKGQLLQREKMAAIGTLSAGLLHELNNPVNYSLMAINMAQTLPAAKSDELLKESLVDAKEGMTRIQNIVTDLKTFAYQNPGDNSQRPFLLEQAIRSAQRLAGHELKGVAVSIEMPQDTHVLGDEPAIIGVLINLFSNAAHALAKAQREQPRIDVRVQTEGGRLRVTVRDNGQGILPENIGRVFEPFFTTRDVGAGLGLGLSVSYGIVQRHGGLLAVESEAGAWTAFTFDLPRPS